MTLKKKNDNDFIFGSMKTFFLFFFEIEDIPFSGTKTEDVVLPFDWVGQVKSHFDPKWLDSIT